MKTLCTFFWIGMSAFGTVAYSQTSQVPTVASQNISSGDFVKKRYTVHGSWEVVTIDGAKAIKFNDDFKTKNGPDLKVFLSRSSIEGLKNKIKLSDAVNIGVLKSNKGEQIYMLPEGVTLSDFESVLIHCEAYSVLWGGFDIPE